MIKYRLRCANGDEFEGWFRSIDDYDAQAAAGALACPICGDEDVRKAMMAPAIVKRGARSGSADAAPAAVAARVQAKAMEFAARTRAHVERHFDYVGDKFADEARRIHNGDAEARGIYGEATAREARALAEDGVAFAPLPAAEASEPARAAPKKTEATPEPARASTSRKIKNDG